MRRSDFLRLLGLAGAGYATPAYTQAESLFSRGSVKLTLPSSIAALDLATVSPLPSMTALPQESPNAFSTNFPNANFTPPSF